MHSLALVKEFRHAQALANTVFGNSEPERKCFNGFAVFVPSEQLKSERLDSVTHRFSNLQPQCQIAFQSVPLNSE